MLMPGVVSRVIYKMAVGHTTFVAHFLELKFIKLTTGSCLEINLDLLNVHTDYVRRSVNFMK